MRLLCWIRRIFGRECTGLDPLTWRGCWSLTGRSNGWKRAPQALKEMEGDK